MLKIDSLTKKYKDKAAVRNLSFQFEKGLLGLLGPNGAGKTTLMKCITSLVEYEGTITFQDQPISTLRIGYLPQKFNFFGNLTVKEGVQYAAIMKDEHRNLNWSHLLEQVNLEEEKDRLIKTLSGGMLRRLGISFALIGKPELIIVDEPTAGLDPLERVSFTGLIKSISENTPVIVSTHIVEDIEDTADVIAVMNRGQIAHSGSALALKESIVPRLFHIPRGMSIEAPHWVITQDTDPISGSTSQRVLFQNRPKELKNEWRRIHPTIQEVYFDAVRNEAVNESVY